MSAARHSSSLRMGVTLGWGTLLSTWLSISSAQMLRICGVCLALALSVRALISSVPRYSRSLASIRASSSLYALSFRASLACHSVSFLLLTERFPPFLH